MVKNKKRKINKKAQIILDVLLDKLKCPKCKLDFGEDGIGWTETGEKTWRIMLEGNDLGYDKDEFFTSNVDEGYFYCRLCGNSIEHSREEVIRILKHYEEQEKD